MNYITIKKENEILSIALNNPTKRNALNSAMIVELTSAFTAVEKDIRIIKLSGEGLSFCAGADLEYMKSMANFSEQENIDDSLHLSNLFYAIVQCPIPVVTIVHGHVFGGALGLVAASDIILAEKNTKFCFSEVNLGLAPAVISTFAAMRMGFSNCRRYFLTGEVFSAFDAKEMQLVNLLYENDTEKEEKFSKLSKRILAAAPKAQAQIKEMTNAIFGLDPQRNLTASEQQQYLASVIAKLRVGQEGQERMTDFLSSK